MAVRLPFLFPLVSVWVRIMVRPSLSFPISVSFLPVSFTSTLLFFSSRCLCIRLLLLSCFRCWSALTSFVLAPGLVLVSFVCFFLIISNPNDIPPSCLRGEKSGSSLSFKKFLCCLSRSFRESSLMRCAHLGTTLHQSLPPRSYLRGWSSTNLPSLHVEIIGRLATGLRSAEYFSTLFDLSCRSRTCKERRT